MNQDKGLDKQKLKKKRIILSIVSAIIIIVFVAVIITILQIKSNVDRMIIPNTIVNTEPSPITDEVIVVPEEEKELKDFYLFVMGLDYRGSHNALLTDSLIVFHIIPEQKAVKLLSIPRDLLVENDYGHQVKINSIFSEGYYATLNKAKKDPSILTNDEIQLGNKVVDKAVLSGAMASTRTEINEILDINIDHTVIVNFNTITSLVDEVGGIEIDVKRKMQYRATNLYLEPGLQTLNGEQALGYARFRHDNRGTRYYATDFERGMHQQEVVKALASKILSWNNVTKVFSLLDIVSKNVQTDMDYSTMYSMVKDYYSLFNGDSFHSIPFPEFYSNSGDVIIPDNELDSLRELFKATEIENSPMIDQTQ